MPLFAITLPLGITLKMLKTAINNEENAGFILKELSVSDDLQVNQLQVEPGAPPENPIEVQDLGATSQEDATAKAQGLLDSLPDSGEVAAFGEVSIESSLKWVAAFRKASIGPQPEAQVPRLPDYAQDNLSPRQGVPWAKARRLPAGNDYLGLFPDTLHLFENLIGLPNGVTTAIYYESKFSIDNDGIGGNDAGDGNHQGETSLSDALGKSLNANRDSFGVLPMDEAEARNEHQNNFKVELKKAELPDFSRELGLNIGDVGVAFWRKAANGEVRRAFFIYADKGPANKLGEGSVHMADSLLIDSDPSNGGFEAGEMLNVFKKGVVHFGFPGSGKAFLVGTRSRLIPSQIEPAAAAVFNAFLRQPVIRITPQALTGDLSEEVPIPPNELMNPGLTPASEATMISKFGRPGQLTSSCSLPSSGITPLLVQDFDVGPFKVTCMKAASELLKAALSEVGKEFPDVLRQVRTDGLGMLCVRHRSSNSAVFSNHSWGTAIDLKFGDKEVPFGRAKAQRGFLALYPIFNKFGWYWGAEFSGNSVDSMHFELAEETIRNIA